MGSNQYWAGRVYDLCVYYMTGTPEGSTKSGLMEKPRIEPATPGLQGVALIHYTTGASLCLIIPQLKSCLFSNYVSSLNINLLTAYLVFFLILYGFA